MHVCVCVYGGRGREIKGNQLYDIIANTPSHHPPSASSKEPIQGSLCTVVMGGGRTVGSRL